MEIVREEKKNTILQHREKKLQKKELARLNELVSIASEIIGGAV